MTRNNLSLFFRSFLGVIRGSAGKKIACNVGDLGSIPGLGKSPEEGKRYPLQYSGLENYGQYSPWDGKELGTTERLFHFQSLDALRFRVGVSVLEEGSVLPLLAIWCTSHWCRSLHHGAQGKLKCPGQWTVWEIAGCHIQGNTSGNRD